MNLIPVIAFKTDKGRITPKQIEALEAVAATGSINAAAVRLGISAPVLYRYIRAAADALGEQLLSSDVSGSRLTPAGEDLLARYRIINGRLRDHEGTVVACSPVTEKLLMAVIPSVSNHIELLISHDRFNISLLEKGGVDMVILDDPLYLMDVKGYGSDVIGYMDMVHVDRGRRYVRYRYGAQRIAFRQLDMMGVNYVVEGEMLSLDDLLGSGRSFFVDEILLLREGIKLQSHTDPRLLRHAIMAVYANESRDIDALLQELKQRMDG